MNRKKRIILYLAIIALLFLGAAIYGYYIKKNDKSSYQVFVDTFDKMYDILNDQVDVDSNSVEGNITLRSSEIKYNENMELLNILNGNNVDLDFKVNYKNKYSFLDINSHFGDNDPINIKKYYNDLDEYTYIENYYDKKYIKKPLFVNEYESLIEKLKVSQDYLNILNGIKNAFFCKENEDYFGWTYQTLNINNKKHSTYNNFIFVNSENYLEIFRKINNSLKSNKDFLKSYKKIFGKGFAISDYEDVTNWFKDNNLSVNIYSERINNKFLKLYIMFNDEKDQNKSFSFELYPDDSKYIYKLMTHLYIFEGNLSFGKNSGEIEINIPADYDETLNIKLNYNLKYKNNIEIEKVSNYIEYYDIMNEYGAVKQTLFDRREIANANEVYIWYLYKNQKD